VIYKQTVSMEVPYPGPRGPFSIVNFEVFKEGTSKEGSTNQKTTSSLKRAVTPSILVQDPHLDFFLVSHLSLVRLLLSSLPAISSDKEISSVFLRFDIYSILTDSIDLQ